MTTRNYTMADAARFGLKDASALSRPGFRYNGADPYARDAAIVALHEYDSEVSSAWEGKPPVGFGSHGPQGEKEGDVCMTNNGRRGKKIDVGGGRLVCIEDPRASDYLRETVDAMSAPTRDVDGLSARDVARIEYEDALCNAWRNPTGSVPASDSVVPAPQRLDPTKDMQRPDLTKDVATIQKEHSVRMQALYNQIDQEISEAYKAR